MKMLLAGEWVEREEKIEVRDPWDNHLIDTVPSATLDDVEKAIVSAQEGFKEISNLTVFERAQILYKTAQIVKENLEDFARTIALEGSKTIREARKEANRCTNTLTVSAEEAKRILGETIPFDSFPGGEKRIGYYYRFPIGIVLAITPFNDPLNLVAHKLGPAFAAGNSVILKPATVTPLSALKLGEALLKAGLPPKALNILTGFGSKIGDALVKDERIRMISFTGGLEAGKRIASMAGIKKIGMELGSNSPVIVLKDCDLDMAVESCVSGAFWACGQNCIGVQRIYIEKEIFDKFTEKFVERTKKYKVGPKLEEDCDMGPVITEGEAKRVEEWVEEAKKLGAKVLCGGKREGAVYWPTVLVDVPENATIHKEEVFGPTVNLYPIKNLDEGIEKANSLPFGLHAAIFTNDVNLAFKAAYKLECGGVMINDSTDYRLDSMPFGGVKYSGLGREGIKFSLQEMTEPKVISFYLPNWR
ncbi:MAG: aldehyde dehydrogenase family protein [Thermoanaerobaculia bacterium]